MEELWGHLQPHRLLGGPDFHAILFLQSDHSWQALFCFTRKTKPGCAKVGRHQPLEGELEKFSKFAMESQVPMLRHRKNRLTFSNDELLQ